MREPESLHLVRYDPVEMHRSLAVFEHALGLVQDWALLRLWTLFWHKIINECVLAGDKYLPTCIAYFHKPILHSCVCVCAIMYKLALSLSYNYQCISMHCCLGIYALGSTRFWSVQVCIRHCFGFSNSMWCTFSYSEGRDTESWWTRSLSC